MMGQCGCGDFHSDRAYDLGNGTFIVVEVYCGCEDCDTPLGITIYRMTKDELGQWGVRRPIKFPVGEHGSSEVTWPFVGRKELMEAAKKLAPQVDIGQYGSLEDLFQDWGLPLLQSAMRQRKYKGGRVIS